MEKEQVLAYGHEHLDLQRRQGNAQPELETVETAEELKERYADLVERVTALPSYSVSSSRVNGLDFIDRHVYVQIDTGDEEIPCLQLHLQTGHYLDSKGNYDTRSSSYLIADWSGAGFEQREHLPSPERAFNEHTSAQMVDNAARQLGLIEESILEAETTLASVAV